ncbi:MAG: DUF6350 family protein [Nakamurella sp.]
MTRLSMQPGGAAATAASALLRAAAAVLAGAALTTGLSLVLWAVTPGAGTEANSAIAAGAVAFAAAHFLPVSISGTALTLTPLLLTAVMIAVIMTAVGRARPVHGRLLEALHASVFVVAYGLGVDAMVALAAPMGAAHAGLGAPLAVAALGAGLSLGNKATAWRAWWEATSPTWFRQATHAAVATVLALVSTAAIVLSIALAASIPNALRITQLTVHSIGDAFGMTMVSLAFVPNAVIAALGYVSGAGFSVGTATYSPLAVHAADLPALPLLSAVPPDGAPGIAAWSTLLAPVVAALVGAWVLRRVGENRWQRLAACGLTALLVGTVVAALVAAGSGGVAGGPWAVMGAAPLLVGPLVAGVVLLMTAATTVPAGWRSLPWRSTASSTAYDAFRGASADGLESADSALPKPVDDVPVDDVPVDDVLEAEPEEAPVIGGAEGGDDGLPVAASAEGEDVVIPDAASAEGGNDVIPVANTGSETQPDDPLTSDADVTADSASATDAAIEGSSGSDTEDGLAQTG